ncbi:MAG: hypothetical protein H6828_03545 [Planctomycetes bacterium]|nr:hypothetical protein [Planctomycetota bacterium]
MKRLFTLAACLALAASCAAPAQQVECLARAQVAPDFATYRIHRVGLLPIDGSALDVGQREVLEAAMFTEFSASTPYEVVPLDPEDLEEIDVGATYLRGRYHPDAVIEVARRYRLDGVFVVTVTDYQFYAPQRLALQIDLVATETGAAVWSSSLHLDATVQDVQRAVQDYYEGSGAMANESGNGWEIALLSPRLFAQFAAWQVARLL